MVVCEERELAIWNNIAEIKSLGRMTLRDNVTAPC